MLSGVQTKVLSKRPVIISLHAGIQQLVMRAKSFSLRAIVLCCGTVGSVLGSGKIIFRCFEVVFRSSGPDTS